MNESTLNRMIREHKARIIWFLVFLILAVFVTALVFGTLKRSVQAQTYTKRVFACSYAQEGAEPVAHKHNDDCYENGELICTLPERELHTHGDECYTEERVLTCTLEEGEGHVHTDACYTEEPVLVCGLEESDGHVHSVENGCYTRVQGDLICTNEDPEHVHTDECYAWEEVLTCEIPEGEGAHHHSEECYETQLVLSCGKEEGEGAHTHDDTCYEIQRVLICDKEEVKTEHVHTVDCFKVVDMSPEEIHAKRLSELPESDPDADVESPDVWESRFASVPLSGHWDRDLLKIAETQLGYTESQRNFDAVLNEDGDGYTLKGWTRYGAWYGIPYGDWCAMFISFCLNYADIPESAIPYDCATTTWIDSLSARGMYAPAGSYDPKPGDLIFFDWEGDGLSDHVGIVWAVNPGSITTIEGNHTPSVELFDYDLSDGHIQGYGILPENPALAVTESEENESGDKENPDEAEGGAASAAETSDSADPSNNNVDTENTEKTELDPETLAKMPPFSYSERVAGMRVTIEADAGAFPDGTSVEINAVEDEDYSKKVERVISGEVIKIQAVEITFKDADGKEIEPLIPIRVTMRPFDEAEEANSVGVVHISDNGAVSAIKPDESIPQPDKGAAFDAESFSQYLLVQYNNNSQEKTLKVLSPGIEYPLKELLYELFYFNGELEDTPTLSPEDGPLSLTQNANNEWILISSREFDESYTLSVKFWSCDRTILLTGKPVETLTTTIEFFNIDDEPEAPTNLTKTYYLLAVLKDKNNPANEIGWALELVSLNNKQNTEVVFEKFHPFDTNTEGLIQYSSIDHIISTRLYCTDGEIQQPDYQKLFVEHQNNATDNMEDGYEIVDNSYPIDGQNEIHIKKSPEKVYQVRVSFDDNARTPIAETDQYYIFIKVTHTSGDTSYQCCPLVITENDLNNQDDVIFEFPRWMDWNGDLKKDTDQNNCFTGREPRIDVSVVKYDGEFSPLHNSDAITFDEGAGPIRNYSVSYDTRASSLQETGAGEYHEDHNESGIIKYYDVVNLNTINAYGDYNYSNILGPNLIYGIVADHFYQPGHVQTTFAVNHFSNDKSQDVQPNLTNNAGSIVISQFNEYIENSTPGNHVGSAMSDGQIFIHDTDPLNGKLIVYVDSESSAGDPIKGNHSDVIAIPMDGDMLKDNIVDPGIAHGSRISSILASRSETFAIPQIPTNTAKFILDTTAFDDYATIYIDADDIQSYISGADALHIKKGVNQTIVFNFSDDYSNLTIGQFRVFQDDFPKDGVLTNSPWAEHTQQNDYMDEIARHIVWNLSGVTGTINISNSGGIFLQPNHESDIICSDTSAGWIISAGFVKAKAEWHSVYSEMPDSMKVKLRAEKLVDNKIPYANQTFSFKLEKLDYNVGSPADSSWALVEEKENVRGNIDFGEIPDSELTPGWNIYKITENVTDSTIDNYCIDDTIYYAAVYVYEVSGTKTPGTPAYYSSFDVTHFAPGTFSQTDVFSDKVSIPAFKNKTITNHASVKVTKIFSGINAKQIPGSFQILASWDLGPNQHETRTLKVSDEVTDSDVERIQNDREGLSYTWIIKYLPENTEVTFEETGYVIDDEHNVTVVAQSEAFQSAHTSEAKAIAILGDFTSVNGTVEFTNTYEIPESLDINVFKVIYKTETRIDGAAFSMRKLDPEGTGDTYLETESTPAEPVPNEIGSFVFNNVADGYYEIYESTTPSGYIQTGDSTFYIQVDRAADKKVIWLEKESDQPVSGWREMPGNHDNTFTVSHVADTLQFTVGNVPGKELPETGGPGAVVYGLIGGMIAVTAGAVLTLRKKKNKA